MQKLLMKQSLLISILTVLVFSFFWRFGNYNERWTLSQDQARDGIIGFHMVQNFTLPLIGPPSSAGMFSFGPYYYWLIALFTLIIPVVNGPWIGFTLLSILTVVVFYFIGDKLLCRLAGVIFALIAEFSAELIFHSTDMLNPIPLSLTSALVILFIILLIDHKKIFYSFLVGLFIGISINFHLQAIGLLIILPLISLINSFHTVQKVNVFLLSIVGLVVSFIPLIIFNGLNQNILFTNIWQFIFANNNSSGVENNLITDLFIFWPQFWGQVIAHNNWLGYIFIILFLIALVIATGKKLNKSLYILGLTLLFQFLFIYIYSGVRSPVYLIVFQSFFIFLSGWIIFQFQFIHKYLSLLLLIILLMITLPANIKTFQNNNSQISIISSIKEKIDLEIFTDVKILSDQNSNMISLPLYYLYKKENKISESGIEIIVCENKLVKTEDGITEKWSCPVDITPIAETDTYKIYKKDSLSTEQQEQFTEIKSEEIYNSLYTNY